MTPVMVTAIPSEPLVDIDRHPLMLDGPLAWAAAMLAKQNGDNLAPITREHAQDFELPLEQWHMHNTWGWCCSAAEITPTGHTSIQLRRKPATPAMARYTQERRHHLALGPHKARDTTMPAIWVDQITWHALTTDRNHLEQLLAAVTHIGKAHSVGYGRIHTWRVEPTTNTTGWKHRPLPDPNGAPQGVRAPYHHPTRRHPCSWNHPA